MAFGAIAQPLILTDPGALFWAPLGTAVPTHVASGNTFTDSWNAPWIPLGATEDGTDFTYDIKTSPVMAAEFFDAIKFMTTERSGSFAFALMDFTLFKIAKAMNGATLQVISGAGTAAQLTKLTPVAAGSETRAMIGWESLDHSLRAVGYQCINSGAVKASFKKAPKFATSACQFDFEVPASGIPCEMWAAGFTRAGA